MMMMNNMENFDAIVDEKFCYPEETHLTARKTSVFFPGDGFLVYDTHGELLFRHDSYGPDSRPKDELVLMDPSGKCLLNLLRKKPSLHQRWEGYIGETTKHQDPIFRVSRSSIIGQSRLVVEVRGDADKEYQIEGSFPRRCCIIYKSYYADHKNTSRNPVAEIKRKVDPTTGVMLGKDVFLLCFKPGVDSAFVMGLVLILDQMYGDDSANDDDDAEHVGPTPLEDSSS